MFNPDDGAVGVDTMFLWQLAIDAKIAVCSFPLGYDSGYMETLRERLFAAERLLVGQTDLDLETVREVLDFAAAIPMSEPAEWIAA